MISVFCLANAMVFAQTISIVAEPFPPFGYKENGKITGLSTEVVHYLLEDTGVKVNKWRLIPWARAFRIAKSKANTLLYTVVRKPDREHLFHWIGPISDRNIYLFRLKRQKEIVVESLEDAKHYTIGTVINTASTQYLKSLGMKVREVVNYEQAVRMMLLGRVGLLPATDYSLAYLAKKVGSSYSEFENVLLLDGSKKYYLVLHKDTSMVIVTALQKSFDKLKKSGVLKEIQSKYLQ